MTQLPECLHDLRELPHWVMWKFQTVKGRSTKVPYQVDHPTQKAATNNEAHWADYDDAVRVLEEHNFDGLGFVLTGTNLVAFDLDDCRNLDTGGLDHWAQELVEEADSYTEITPSGKGLRIIGKGGTYALHTTLKRPTGHVEVYSKATRYITVSGNRLDNTPDRIADLDELVFRHLQEKEDRGNGEGKTASADNGFDFNTDAPQQIPTELCALIRNGVDENTEDRSEHFHHAIGWLKDLGYSPDSIEALLAKNPNGIAQKYNGRLREEIDRSYSKCGSKPHGAYWPALIPLGVPTLPRLAETSLNGWAGDYTSALAKATETPLELPWAMVLASCSVAVARRFRVMIRPGYFEPTNLWLAAALPPGNRKSAVQNAAAAPLLKWEREQAEVMAEKIKRVTSEVNSLTARANYLRNQAAKEKVSIKREDLNREVADIEENMPEGSRPPQLWTSDATPERLGTILADNEERMAWLSSEGGVFDLLAGRYSGGIPNLDLVLKAHSGDSERVDRGSRPPVFLRHLLLTIGLSPQPSVLQGLASKPGFRGRGLLGRFLYLLPPSPLGSRNLEGPPVPERVAINYEAGIRSILDMPPATNADGDPCEHLLSLSGSPLIFTNTSSRCQRHREYE